MVDVVKEVQTPNGAVSIGGSYDPSFEAVFKEFEQSLIFAEFYTNVSLSQQNVNQNVQSQKMQFLNCSKC